MARTTLLIFSVLWAIGCTPTVKLDTSEPITINLNVNIKHEILVKVDKQLDDLFSSDKEYLLVSTAMLIRNMVAGICLVLVSSLALAEMSIDDAKARGLVGEDATGYLAAVVDAPSREVRALISTVNEKRREEYERIAEANNIQVGDVEKLAARKAFEKTLPGHYMRRPGTSWQMK